MNFNAKMNVEYYCAELVFSLEQKTKSQIIFVYMTVEYEKIFIIFAEIS